MQLGEVYGMERSVVCRSKARCRRGAARRGIGAFLCGILAFVTGCSDSTPCDLLGAPPSPAVIVMVWDPTGTPIAEGVVGSVHVQGDTIALQHVEENEFWAYGPMGLYEVVISAGGYEEWRAPDVEVRGGRCDVISARLDAALLPRSPAR